LPNYESSRREEPVCLQDQRSGPILGNALDLGCKDILAPFPDIARHVIDAELVWRFPPNRLRVIAMLSIIPRYRIDVVAATEAETVGPVWTAAGGVLPLGL
jgi:hypothetical protein